MSEPARQTLLADYPAVIDIPVAWGEMDALGHINNSRYFVWCEQSRIDWLDSMGESDYLSGS